MTSQRTYSTLRLSTDSNAPDTQPTIPVDSELGKHLLSAGFVSFERGNTFCKGDGLVWAASHGKTGLVRQLLDDGTDVNVKSGIMGTGSLVATALHFAAYYNHCDTLELLLNSGADTGALASFNDTPLHIAARRGHVDAVRILLEHGADPELMDCVYGTALHGAVSEGHTDVVELLLHHQPFPLHNVDSVIGLTPIDLACIKDHQDCLELLLKAEADLHLGLKDIDGNRLCQAAAQSNSRKCMRLLIASGIPGTGLLDRGKWSRTPFLHAVHNHQWELATELLECGSNVNDQDEDGASAAMIAAAAGDSSDFIRFLHSKNADFTLTSGKGDSALHFAARENQKECCQFLTENGADPEARNHRRETPLLIAAKSNHLEVVQQLITLGADIHAQDGQFRSALTWAVYQGSTAMARLLLINGANPEQKTADEISPWRMVLERDMLNMTMVRLILDHGIRVNSRVDSEPWTALHIAVLRCQEALVAILLDYGADPMAEGLNGIPVLNLTSTSIEAYSAGIRYLLTEAKSAGKNSNLIQALGCAISKGRHSQTERLLEEEFDMNVRDLDGRLPLSRAAELGNGETFGMLMSRGARLTLQDAHEESPLWWACRYGHMAIVQRILGTNPDLVNAGDADGLTPLMVACQKRHIDIVRILLDQGSQNQVVRMTSKGRTALHYAAIGGCPLVTGLLVDNGANLGHHCKFGKTPWDLAQGGDPELLRILYVPPTEDTLNTDINQNDDVSQSDAHSVGMLSSQEGTNAASDDESENDVEESADDIEEIENDLEASEDRRDGPEEVSDLYAEELEGAVLNNRGAAIRRLVKAGASVHRPIKGLVTLIFLAAIRGNSDAVMALVENGAKANWTNENGDTAMHFAAFHGSTSVFRTLLDRGCSLESINNLGQTPLALAALKGKEEAVRELVKLDANVNSTDNQGRTPLLYAIWEKHLAVVRILLEKGADYQQADHRGHTSFSLAIARNDRQLVELFLERGYSIAHESNRIPPLLLAAGVGAEPVVNLLLEHGFDANYSTRDTGEGYTPLITAAKGGYTTIVMMLIDAGADPDVTGPHGETALSIAKDSGHEPVVKFLYESRSRQGRIWNRSLPEGSRQPYQTPKFKYAPLQSETGIRILHLHPGEPGSIISFDLEEVCLNSKTSFDALSYEWGDKTGTVPVECSQRRLLITPNCKAAIESLRDRTKVKALWIDAICINQNDIPERNHQVAMMRTIFSKCKRMWMWLGDEDPTTELAFRVIPKLVSIRAEAPKDLDRDSIRGLFPTPEDLRNRIDSLGAHEDYVGALVNLADKSYFTRIWIAQEVILAGSRGIIKCGTYQCSFTDFETAFSVMECVKELAFGPLMLLQLMRHEFLGEERVPNGVNLLTAFTAFNATDKRDRVFVPLSLANIQEKDEVKIPKADYNLEDRDVSIRTAKYLIASERDLDLFMLGRRSPDKICQDLPSWVPDFCSSGRESAMTIKQEFAKDPYSDPSKQKVALRLNCCVPRSRIDITGTSLFVNALDLDSVVFGKTIRRTSDLYIDILEPAFSALVDLDIRPCDIYTPDRDHSRQRTYIRALVDIIGLDNGKAQLPHNVGDFLTWKFSGTHACSSGCNAAAAYWESMADAKSEELVMYSAMEDCITDERNLIITKKGVVALSHTSKDPSGQRVVLLATAQDFVLCDVKPSDISGEVTYYEIVEDLYTDHLYRNSGEMEVQPHELWPGEDYQVRRIEIR